MQQEWVVRCVRPVIEEVKLTTKEPNKTKKEEPKENLHTHKPTATLYEDLKSKRRRNKEKISIVLPRNADLLM